MNQLCSQFFVVGVDDYLELDNPKEEETENNNIFNIEFKSRILDKYPEKSDKDDPSIEVALPLVRVKEKKNRNS